MPASLLSTKLYIPRPRPNAIARPRLTDKLLAGVNQPNTLVLLSGPAGFGKTTLLSDSVAQLQQPVAWLSLDEGDNDPIRFWTYLIAACQSIQTGLGESVLASLQSPQPLPDDAIPTILINELVRLPISLVLILDDYHVIQNQSIHAALAFLLDHLPTQLHLVLSTRLDPPWPLARLRARSQLIELRAADLRFTSDEAAAFLNQVMDLNLSSEDVAALEARTEGWIAGLQLAALAMQSQLAGQGRDHLAAFVKAFTGSHVYIAEYLIEEVIARQPASLQDFLLKTSILDRLTAAVCEAVTGQPHGQASLMALQRANLFLVPLDDEGQWFRYHQLFADLLRARLRQTYSAEAIVTLHQRAADWYEQAGTIPEAIEQALAAVDYMRVVRLVEKIALPTILQAHVRTVESWLQAIPRAYLDQSPKTIMAWAWLHLLRGSAVQATPYLDQLAAVFSSPEIGKQDPLLIGEWLALQSKLLGLQGKPAESRDLANRALPLLPETEAHVRSMIYANLAIAYQQTLDYDEAGKIFQIIVREARATGNFALEILGISGHAKMALQQGQLHLGFELASQGIQRLEEAERSTPFSATLYGELGQIYYHWHQLEPARRYFSRSVQASGLSGYSDPEIYQHVMLSRMCQLAGDWSAAAGEMQQANELARRIPPAMIREEIIAQQVRVDLATDRLAAAQAILNAEGFGFEDTLAGPDLTPDASDTESPGLLYNSALRVVLCQAKIRPNAVNLKRGIDLASRVLARELQCRHIPIALETLLLRSQMYGALSDHPNSLADVAQALQLAEPEGFISIFVEEGRPMAEALTRLLERHQAGADRANLAAHTSFIRNILAAFPDMQTAATPQSKQPAPAMQGAHAAVMGDEPPTLIEPLTARELEVLHLIAAGDSNRVIADKLVITVSAVKKHTSNIFGKLNAGSRTQAVARARQIGLLSADG